MKLQAVHNTKEKGIIYYAIFREEDDYVAVCLNLNIIEYGKDPELLRKSIVEAAMSYVESVRKKNLPDDYLNKYAPKKYWDRLALLKDRENQSPKKDITISDLKSLYFVLQQYPYYHGHLN